MRYSLAILLLVAACSQAESRADQLQKELEVLERNRPTDAERCRKLREIEAALLAEGREKEYAFERRFANEACLTARLR